MVRDGLLDGYTWPSDWVIDFIGLEVISPNLWESIYQLCWKMANKTRSVKHTVLASR